MRLPGNTATTSAEGVDAERAPRAVTIDLQRDLIGQRMADELGPHAVLAA